MSVQQQQRLSSGQNANKWKWIQLDVLKVKLFSTSVEGQFSKNSWRCKMGRRITRNCNSSLSSPPGPTGRAVLLPQLVNRLRVCWRAVSRLQQRVFGDEPLHALPFQKLHGSPVDLAAVLWLSERTQLLLDVLQPQIFGETKPTVQVAVHYMWDQEF